MSDQISALPAATTLSTSDLVVVVDVSDTPPATGLTKKATLAQVSAAIGGGGGGSTPTGTGFRHVTANVEDAAAALVVNADVDAAAAIAYSKLNLSGGIVNADVNASAAIDGTKVDPDFGSQNVTTTGAASIGPNCATTGDALRLGGPTGGYTTLIKVKQNADEWDFLNVHNAGASYVNVGPAPSSGYSVLWRSYANSYEANASHTFYIAGTIVDQRSKGASDFSAYGAAPATSGFLRLSGAASTQHISQRYSGSDYNVFRQDGGAGYVWGSTTFVSQIDSYSLVLVSASQPAYFYVGGPLVTTLSSTGWQFGGGLPDHGGGSGVLGIDNAGTDPTTNPTGGGILYASGGAGKWRGSSGTVTTFGPADLDGFLDTAGHGHCPECGTDFAMEWANEKYGSLTVCMKCLSDELGERPWIVRKTGING